MKVLMIGPSRKAKGGMTTVVNNYFESPLVNKINIKYISSTIDGSIFYRLIYNVLSFMKILISLIFFEVDIVHVHMASRGSFYRKSIIVKLSKIFKKKVIIHLHGACFKEFYENECNKILKNYVKNVFQSVEKVIVLSDEWKKIVEQWFECKIEVVENAVFVPNENFYNKNSKNISMLGRLNERKGTYDLLDVIKSLKDEGKINNIKFILAGDGDLQKLESTIAQMRIGDVVDVLGWIDIRKREMLLKDSLIYLLPSYNEGMPMSVLEAMSYGVPTISTIVGGIPRVITDSENGYLIIPGDKEKLKEKIELLIKNESIRNEISRNSYLKIKHYFSIESNIKKIESIYNEIL